MLTIVTLSFPTPPGSPSPPSPPRNTERTPKGSGRWCSKSQLKAGVRCRRQHHSTQHKQYNLNRSYRFRQAYCTAFINSHYFQPTGNQTFPKFLTFPTFPKFPAFPVFPKSFNFPIRPIRLICPITPIRPITPISPISPIRPIRDFLIKKLWVIANFCLTLKIIIY